ncbi:MAG: DUF4255 domain-containing protein [Thermoflexales bacterium]|nr:DUF4255 domain-containing protein [Thermoflexales bacterium]
MIDELDEVLRQFLIRELPIKNNEIDIAFDQPGKTWSARVSQPTLNVYLYDVRENVKLRVGQQVWDMERNDDGSISQRRKPVRVDLHYLVTAWTTEPEDEHRLLTRTLLALFRHQNIPDDLLPESLQDQPTPIPLKVAQYDMLEKPSDFWNVMDNQQRPGITLMVTLALNPYQAITGPAIRTRELRIGQAQEPASLEKLIEAAGAHTYWTIGGTIHSKKPLKNLHLKLIERDQSLTVQDGNRFAIGNLPPGTYTLEIMAEGRKAAQKTITVPAPDYDIDF